MNNTNQIFYFPFCQDGYWPTAHDAVEEMRKIRNRGHKIDVYEKIDDAIRDAEATVMDDQTWIVVEIKVEGNHVAVNLAQNNDYEPIKLYQFEREMIEHFRVHDKA